VITLSEQQEQMLAQNKPIFVSHGMAAQNLSLLKAVTPAARPKVRSTQPREERKETPNKNARPAKRPTAEKKDERPAVENKTENKDDKV
jgi:hypothetical protein